MKKKIFICATEQSGDNIGKIILTNLIKKYPLLIIDGVCGSQMKPLIKKQFYSIDEFKSIGIIEILFSLKKYIKIINILSSIIIKKKYDLIITIDSPDFNYPLAKKIRQYGFKGKIIQIVAPTVWAWRQNRAKKFAKVFDEILTLFHFENKFFEKFKLQSTCIGHPIYYIKNKSSLIKKKNNIAFLPGSRMGEINVLFNFYQLAYEQLLKRKDNIQIFIPTLPHTEYEIIKRTKHWKIPLIISSNKSLIEKNFIKTKFAIVCSGTASLEIAKRGIPQIVIYKLNFLTELILYFFIKIKYATIINIYANKMIIPEIINSRLNKTNFIKILNNCLKDRKSQKKQIIEVNNILKKIELKKSPGQIAFDCIKRNL